MSRKIKLISVFISIFITLTVIFMSNPLIENISADEVTIPAELYTELSKGDSVLPQLVDSDVWIYKVELFNIADVDRKYNLTDDSLSFSFNQPGDYILRYKILYKVDNLAVPINIYKETILHVEDTIAPKIELKGVDYKQDYTVGEVLEILPVKVVDNSKSMINASVCVYLKEKMISLKNNRLHLKEKGNYRIVYEAVDESGNSGKLEYKFRVK